MDLYDRDQLADNVGVGWKENFGARGRLQLEQSPRVIALVKDALTHASLFLVRALREISGKLWPREALDARKELVLDVVNVNRHAIEKLDLDRADRRHRDGSCVGLFRARAVVSTSNRAERELRAFVGHIVSTKTCLPCGQSCRAGSRARSDRT